MNVSTGSIGNMFSGQFQLEEYFDIEEDTLKNAIINGTKIVLCMHSENPVGMSNADYAVDGTSTWIFKPGRINSISFQIDAVSSSKSLISGKSLLVNIGILIGALLFGVFAIILSSVIFINGYAWFKRGIQAIKDYKESVNEEYDNFELEDLSYLATPNPSYYPFNQQRVEEMSILEIKMYNDAHQNNIMRRRLY